MRNRREIPKAGRREDMERKLKVRVAPLVAGPLKIITTNLEKWLQQTPGIWDLRPEEYTG